MQSVIPPPLKRAPSRQAQGPAMRFHPQLTVSLLRSCAPRWEPDRFRTQRPTRQRQPPPKITSTKRIATQRRRSGSFRSAPHHDAPATALWYIMLGDSYLIIRGWRFCYFRSDSTLASGTVTFCRGFCFCSAGLSVLAPAASFRTMLPIPLQLASFPSANYPACHSHFDPARRCHAGRASVRECYPCPG